MCWHVVSGGATCFFFLWGGEVIDVVVVFVLVVVVVDVDDVVDVLVGWNG